ncbi:dipeptide epimerase [Ktedonobacter racemifer]|uniref:Dipeptide epimerase n=1 Tax=Ktedonobacter racemifer DSM 44963 TaxID=485913 RepID=D6TQE1_KTERA|nr:dipeptide epimerase [Ktedonobacter racemifer]EFH85789.1 Mandelate racemase/muconate lactonizing protein [Ktedonobacter racemifer DSM 44963]
MVRTTITAVKVEPLNIPLRETFTVTTGSVSEARNVLITIELADGSIGYGECSPFAPSTGESQETALAAAWACVPWLEGQDASRWRPLSKHIKHNYYHQNTVRTGIEMALLDALTRSYGIPLYVFLGNASTTVETDMSIPLTSPEHSYELAQQIATRGVKYIKIKVGVDMQEDIARIEAIHRAAPTLALTLDANQGYTPDEALSCLRQLEARRIYPILLEQPVYKDDFEGLRYVTQHTSVPVAADESAASLADVERLVAMKAVNVVNIKLMKCGIVEALDIAALCRATSTQLMIGSMIESRLGTSASAHFVAGLGGFRFIDLDVPLLLAEDPFTGGYVEQQGGIYDVSGIESGLGIARKV